MIKKILKKSINDQICPKNNLIHHGKKLYKGKMYN